MFVIDYQIIVCNRILKSCFFRIMQRNLLTEPKIRKLAAHKNNFLNCIKPVLFIDDILVNDAS